MWGCVGLCGAVRGCEEMELHDFEEGSMGPKVEAACDFVRRSGGRAVIGALSDLEGMVAGTAGTQFVLE